MTETLSDLTVSQAANLALELILLGGYQEFVKPTDWRPEGHGHSFREYLDEEGIDDEDFDTDTVWQHLFWEGSEGTRDGLTGKVEKTFGGEGKGDSYWMVISVSDGNTTRYFRRDGWYASYDGGYLDGQTFEVSPAEKVVVVYE